MASNNKTIVFLGPTLPKEEAIKILPNAFYLPPIQCGDIFRALRLKPQTIAIIDGVFENCAAVWHKEILIAIEQGITVYGASSMGALRAAELSDLGMLGVGEIFEKFHNGTYTDDDEVAVLHTTSDDYAAVNEPMVNLRATLNNAQNHNVIDSQTTQLITNAAKQLFYRDRDFVTACEMAITNGAKPATIEQFQDWLENNNYVDQKKLDAIELLELLATNIKIKHNSLKTNRSIFIRTLHKDTMCKTFPHNSESLPIAERVAIAAKNSDKYAKLLYNLANILATLDALATAEPNHTTTQTIIKLLPDSVCNSIWEQNNDCSTKTKLQFIERITRIQQYANYFLTTKELNHEPYLRDLLRNINEYSKYKIDPEKYQQTKPHTYKLLTILSYLWCALDSKLNDFPEPNLEYIQTQANKFRIEQELHTAESTKQWLATNDMDLDAFQEFITKIASFNFIVLKNNLDILKANRYDESVWWLLDALWISELYDYFKVGLIQP